MTADLSKLPLLVFVVGLFAIAACLIVRNK